MRLVFIDTETTSLARPGTVPPGRVIEFCGIPVDVSVNRVKNGRRCVPYWEPVINVRRGDMVYFRLELTKKDLRKADKESLRINNYHNDNRAFAATTALNNPTTRKLWQQASDLLAGRIMCSQNIAFDIQFVEKELELYGLSETKRWQRKHLELWSLSLITQLTEIAFHENQNALKAVTENWNKNNIISLSDAARCIDPENNHTAHTTTGDVEMGISIFEHFVGQLVSY